MALSAIVDSKSLCSVAVSPCSSPKFYIFQTPLLVPNSQSVSSSSVLKLNTNQFLLPKLALATRNSRSFPVISASQSSIFKVIRTAWNVGKDGIEAATNMVPDSIPRPIARASVTVVALAVSLSLVKSFLSTVFFALIIYGLYYAQVTRAVIPFERCQIPAIPLYFGSVVAQYDMMKIHV